MVNSLFFCAIPTSCRRGHTPFVQARVETSDTGAKAVKPDLCCSKKSPDFFSFVDRNVFKMTGKN